MILDNEDILIQAAIDSARYEMVDLGLSVKWANKNIGASHPEDAGLYFQWGDTVGYTADQIGVDKVFDKYSYPERLNVKYNSTNGLKSLEPEDDAATVHMGSSYRMPTIDEIRELINNTTQIFIDLDGNEYSTKQAQNGAIKFGKLKGVKFTGPNCNSIFIPAAGFCDESLLFMVGLESLLWSSCINPRDYVNVLYFSSYSYIHGSSNSDRYYGRSIRGVK